MYDLQCKATGEILLELVSVDELRTFLTDIHLFEDYSKLTIDGVIRLLELSGYSVYQID